MRIPCPHCGERALAEFKPHGAADPARPGFEAPPEAWDEYMHVRPNPIGPYDELWHHAGGCRRFLVLTRDTRSHAILSVRDA